MEHSKLPRDNSLSLAHRGPLRGHTFGRMSGRVAFSEPELGLFGECNRLGNHKDDPHKGLWPLDWRDVVGYTFAAVSLFIAAGGGIGGGGILVPLYILVMGEASLPLHTKAMPAKSLQPCS